MTGRSTTTTWLLLGDATLEALARELARTGGAATLDIDELSAFLRGLGEYKGGSGGDRGRFLQLWERGPWRITRVGGAGAQNKVRINLAEPTVPYRRRPSGTPS